MNRARTNAQSRSSEGGSIALLMAASLGFFMALAAIAIDIGYLYLAQRRAQVVADLAALGGAVYYTKTSQTAATNAAQAIETANGYPTAAPTYPTSYQVSVTLTTPTTQMFFGKILGLASRGVTVTAVASAGNQVPAIWSGGGCGSPTGLQLNGGGTGYIINGDLDSYGQLNFFTSPGGTINGSLTNSNAAGCLPPTNGGNTVTGSQGSVPPSALPPDPFGYNINTDFPACMFGTSLTSVGIYNVPVVGGVITPGVYCAGSNGVNISSGGTINATQLTVLTTGPITVSGPGINITGTYPGAHGIAFFSTWTTADCATQAINLGFPGGTVDGNAYAPNGCFQISGDSYTLDGAIAANEVQYGAGNSWTIDSSFAGTDGKIGLLQ
jgi:hypothetical protein